MPETLKATKNDFEEFLKTLVYHEGDQLLTLYDLPALVTPHFTLAAIMDAAVETVGWDKAREIMYKSGYNIGYSYVSRLGRSWGVTGEELIKRYLRYENVRGLGLWEIVDLDVSTGKSTIRGNGGIRAEEGLIFSNFYRAQGVTKYADSFFAGLIAGMIYAATGKKVKATERRCFAMIDTYCEFVTTPE